MQVRSWLPLLAAAGALATGVACAIPEAARAGKPGSRELRDALEATRELFGVHGVFTMTTQDHNGLDKRARMMIRIGNRKWLQAK